MAEGLQGAGDFIIEELRLVTSNSVEIDLIPQVIGLNLFESITDMSVSGTIAIQDPANIVSTGPIIGQEYLHLKIKTPLFNNKSTNIDFKDNAFFVHTVSKRQQIGNGVQGVVLSFVSAELVKNQRLKVTKKLEGTWSDIVEDMLLKEIKTGKRVIIENSVGAKKLIAPNIRPLDIAVMSARQAVALHKSQPTFLFYESLKGFNFRSLASLYNEPALIEYTPHIAGGNVNRGIIDVQKDLSTILDYEIVSNNDSLINYRTGMYGSELIVHDILSKSFIKQIYNYHDSFAGEEHIVGGGSDGKPEYPLISDIMVEDEDGGRRVSDYPARTFLLPTSLVNGSDSQHITPNGSFSYSGYDPQAWVQRRHSQMLQLENGFNINIVVHGNTLVSAGNKVDVNIPYTAAVKSAGKDQNDKFYSGPFLVKKIRHEFEMTSSPRKHKMYMNLVKDSLDEKLGAGGPTEPSKAIQQPLEYDYGYSA